MELFKKLGRKDDNFSKFFREGKNPYNDYSKEGISKEAKKLFYGHADHCKIGGKK